MASADVNASPTSDVEKGSSGEYVLKKLFAEFVLVSDRKLQLVTQEPLEYSLAKGLQKGEDAQFDQLLSALNEVSIFCLRSVLTSIFKWRDMQIDQSRNNTSRTMVTNSSDTTDVPFPASKREKEVMYLTERRELAVEFLFCLVLIEVLTQLSVHPVPESFIHSIEDLAFRHFKLQESIKDRTNSNPNVPNMKKIADLYAEVIGVLSRARFHSVRRRFFLEIRNPAHSSATIISIIEGMSFIRVKMFPVEELEQWFAFLQECANFFLECPREKIKSAMSSLLVEILLPVAAVISLEASLPVARKLVSMLYGHCVEHAKRARHSNTYIPLATVLLAISEQPFFLNNWHQFLVQHLLSNIRRGDSKVQNIGLTSLYRLVWVYMVRIKGESNKTTMDRLRLILETLFPRGQRGVQPKEMPLNIFVKIIQFIARERLEYVMQEVILELLSQGRTKMAINPERMIISLRAFLMITDSLEKEEGDPPMPFNPGPLPSGGLPRIKSRFLSNTLSNKTAKKIGIAQFYLSVCKSLNGILRSLDLSVGRNLTSTTPPIGKSVEEVLSGVKPKLDLLKTCVAAIPRIFPQGMSLESLTDMLSRLTIHLDHELSRTASNSLFSMVTNFPSWRHNIVRVFVQFLLRDIPDSCPLVLEAGLKGLIQFISHWRLLITTTSDPDRPAGVMSPPPASLGVPEEGDVYCVPWVEACGLVTLCSYRSMTRRLSLVLLREVRSLHEAMVGEPNRSEDSPVMDVVDLVTPTIIKRYLGTISQKERAELRGVVNLSLNLTWLADRAACFLEHGGNRETLRDPWALCLAGLMEPHLLLCSSPTALRLAWPHFFHRMQKAYNVLDPSGMVSEKGEKPSSIRGKQRPTISSVETFLWRNYLIAACCSAPPSTELNLALSAESSVPEGSVGRVPGVHVSARDLYHRTVPLIRWDGEIREVAITALGLAHPQTFSDLVDQLHPLMHDALEQRKDVKRKRRREVLKIQITRVLALAAEHGCFHHSRTARTNRGEISPVLHDFIDGIKNYLDAEKDGVQSYPELRLHFAALIANIVNSVPRGEGRILLFTPPLRQSLFYLFANWCGLFGQRVDLDVRSRNPQLSFNSLQAMSALLCCGPVFQSDGLEGSSAIYRWLDNMLNCGEARVQTLGRKTIQLLLHNNHRCSTLLSWVVDRCYDNRPSTAQLCFHALSNTIAMFHDYPCDMVTLLHVALYKTGDSEQSTRQRATQLLQLLDKRFLADNGHTRSDLLGCLTGGTYSHGHMVFSRELATANPELTFPLFCEMVYRFEMAPRSGQRNILQCMVPWVRNVELVEEGPHSPYLSREHRPSPGRGPSSTILKGNGWGSMEGTKVVLHNLLYITAKYGEEHVGEVESLWSALCTWQTNIRVSLNYLARLTCVAGHLSLMVQHAKKIVVCFSHSKAKAIVSELIKELQVVEMISADLQPADSPPFYSLVGAPHEPTSREGREEGWAEEWRSKLQLKDSSPISLPTPGSKMYYADLHTLLKLPTRQLAPLHRCNFALIVLSELVIEQRSEIDWAAHLPLLLHVALLGLDLFRPLVFEHSKALLGNLVIVLACKDDKMAALQARYVQQEVALLSPTATSPSLPMVEDEEGDLLLRQSSIKSLTDTGYFNSSLMEGAQELIRFIAHKDSHRSRWPFADISSRLNPSGEVPELSLLVGKIISVFLHVFPEGLKEKWARIALHWATGCSSHQYASQSFQVCRALQLPLSPSMFREILTRLAESASDTNEDMQSYVLEIVLTLECALDHLPHEPLARPSKEPARKISDLPPLPSEVPDTPSSLSPPASADSGAGVRSRHCRVRSITSKSEMVPPWTSSGNVLPDVSLPVLMIPQPSSSSSVPQHSHHLPFPSGFTRPCTSPHYPPLLTTIASAENVNKDDGGTTDGAGGGGGGGGGGEVTESGGGETEMGVSKEGEEEEEVEENKEGEGARAGYIKLLPINVSTDWQAQAVSLSSTPQKGTIEHFHAFSDITGLSTGSEYKLEPPDDSRPRKSSEPPPSLMALFEKDTGSSRRVHKQRSTEESHTASHPKQGSLDNTLDIPPTHPSPKHRRRVKSPSACDKEKERERSRMQRAPSHPHLHQTSSSAAQPSPVQSLTKASSIQQLRSSSSESDESQQQRGLSSEREDEGPPQPQPRPPHPQPAPLQEQGGQERPRKALSRESLAVRPREDNVPQTSSTRGPAKESDQRQQRVRGGHTLHPASSLSSSASKLHSDLKRRNSTQIGSRKTAVNVGGPRGGRPHSMVETSSSLRPQHSIEFNPTPSDLVTQMFWTAVSLLESDFEAEFFMALRLISKCLKRLDLSCPDTMDRMERLMLKFRWPAFPGVQALLMKGLTLDSLADTTRSLLSHITPHSTQRVFDPSQHAGLALNIMALMPVLVHHFSGPTPFCRSAVDNILLACESAKLSSSGCKIKLQHMSKMFEMYNTGEFTNSCDIWLAGVCRYLNEAYCSLATDILKLLTAMLEQGPSLYHRPVLRLLYEYLHLQEPRVTKMHAMVSSIVTVVHRHLKGPLWKEAVDLLKLAVSNSAALVQPPTRGLPVVDLGLFNQTLPGPTLQFSMDLQSNSSDICLAEDESAESPWKNPAGSQRHTRERLLCIINACVPLPVLMSSPSVVFADEQFLMDKGTMQSTTSDEASESIASVQGDLASQPEAQSLISVEFNFLDNMEYIYDSSSESEALPGPFSRREGVEVAEEEEEEESFSEPEVTSGEMELSGEVEGDTSEETSIATLLSTSFHGIVEAEEMDVLEYEEEPLPPLLIPYDVTGSGRGLLNNHEHESSHASTFTEGSYESHDTSLESHAMSTESHDMREVSAEEGGESLGREEGEESITEEIVVAFDGERDERRREEEGSKGEENGKKHKEEEEEEVEHIGIKDDFAEEEEPGPKEEEEEVLSMLEEVLKEEEEKEEEEEEVLQEEEEEEEAAIDEEEEVEEEKEERAERRKIEKGENHTPEDTGKADSRDAQMKDVSPTRARKEERGETEETQEEQEERSHKEKESKEKENKEKEEEEEEEEEEERREEMEAQERRRAVTNTEAAKEEKVSRDESPHDQEMVLTSGSEDYPLDEVCGEDKEEARELRESSNVPASVPPACTRQGEKGRGGGGGGMKGVAGVGVVITSGDSNCNGPASSGSMSVSLATLDSMLLSQGTVQDPLDGASGGPEHPPGVLTACNHNCEDSTQGYEPSPLQDRPVNDARDASWSSDVRITVQDAEAELSAAEVECLLNTARERRESAGHDWQNSLGTEEGDRQRSPSPQRSALEGSCEGQKSEFEGSCEDVDRGGKREGAVGGGRDRELEEEAEDAPEERLKHDGHMMPQEEAILSSDTTPDVSHSMSQLAETRVETSRFINITNDEIIEAWKQHVARLSRNKSGAVAVHTYYLFGRLFFVLRQQFSMLTREACNYLGETYHSIASHFLVTVELLLSQLELPKIYIDSELLAHTRLVDSHVFRTLEINGNLQTYHERRRTVLERLDHIKQQLRQQSLHGQQPPRPPPAQGSELTPQQAMLKLCQAVHQLHFQLLVLLGSYVKLLHTLQPHVEHSRGVEMSVELTETKRSLAESVEVLNRVPTPPLEGRVEVAVAGMCVQEAVRSLEDTLSQKQWTRAVQLLRSLRKRWKGLEMFGCGEEDDVDCLFYIYARYLTERQEGVVCLTRLDSELADTHSQLMAQNVSLHSLLDQTCRELVLSPERTPDTNS